MPNIPRDSYQSCKTTQNSLKIDIFCWASLKNHAAAALNSFKDSNCSFINLNYIQWGKTTHPWSQGSPSELKSDEKPLKNRSISPSTFEMWLKSCCSSPRFLPRPNWQICPISSASREAKLDIHNQKGPLSKPQYDQKHLKIVTFPLSTLEKWLKSCHYGPTFFIWANVLLHLRPAWPRYTLMTPRTPITPIRAQRKTNQNRPISPSTFTK